MKKQSRRGAIVVMVGIMAVSLMSISAISIDFSRMWTLRNELQTTADAAAHAGAVQLAPPNNANLTDSIVRAYAGINPAMQGAVTVDSVILGDWDDANKLFIPWPTATTVDAVSVTVSRQTTGLMMTMLGVAQPRIRARAIGWADAPVSDATGCIKPWAIPYTVLMYKLNVWRNTYAGGNFFPPESEANLTRTFDQVEDLKALQQMEPVHRTFTLKEASGNTMSDSGAAMPGNYQAVKLPPIRFADGSTNPVAPPSGGDAYRDNIAGAECHSLEVGDILGTEGGNMPGPTFQGVTGTSPAQGPGVCKKLIGYTDNTNKNDPTFGDCLDENDGQVDVKAAFYYCSTKCNGRTEVEVKLLGSFTLKKIYPQGDGGPNPAFERSQIVGIFKPVTDPGTVGTGSTMYTQVIIVR